MTNMKSLVGLTLLGLALPASATTLFFAGDSTLDDNGLSLGGRIRAPYYSWGTQLQKAMKTGDRVANYARSGASTKSFAASGRWTKLIAAVQPGDFVAIQFGHNDPKCATPADRETRWADPTGLVRGTPARRARRPASFRRAAAPRATGTGSAWSTSSMRLRA